MSAFYEREEIERTVSELKLGGPEVVDSLEFLFEHAQVTYLDRLDRILLDNFDNDVQTISDVKAKLVGYGRDIKVIDRILGEMQNGMWFPPLILRVEGRLVLVAGNTRLMVAKVTNHRPPVKIVDWR